jgi:acyl dehydratase
VPDPDFSAFPLEAKGHAFEDFEVGGVFPHHWGRTLTESDATLFATVTLSYSPLYTNREAALALGHPTTPVHPMLVLSTVVGLSVEDLSEAGGPFLGMEDVAFHHPVYPGDTLTATSEVVAVRDSGSRPDFGIVTWHTRGFDAGGRCVVEYHRSNLVARRRTN